MFFISSFYFLLRLVRLVVCAFICLGCLFFYMQLHHQFRWGQFILPVLFKIRFVCFFFSGFFIITGTLSVLVYRVLSSCVFSFCFVLKQFTLFLFLDFIIDVCRLLGLNFHCPFFFLRSYNSVLKLSRVHKALPSSHWYREYHITVAEESRTSTNTKLFVTLKIWPLLQNPPVTPRPPVMILSLRLWERSFTSQLSSSRRISSPCWPTRIFPVLSKRSRTLISPSGGLCHIAHRRVEEDCRISNRIFTPISGHLHVLFATELFAPLSLHFYRFLFLYILYCPFFSFPFSSSLGWHSQRETYVPSRITGAEFAIPWALPTVSSVLVFQDTFSWLGEDS